MSYHKPIIFGAKGFIGKHLLHEIGIDHCIPITRNSGNKPAIPAESLESSSRASVFCERGDPGSIRCGLPRPAKSTGLAMSHLAGIADNEHWKEADLLKIETILPILKKSDSVINLAYSSQLSPDLNIQMAKNLIEACQQARIKKLVHCSTAVVIGNNSSTNINEYSICLPYTAYEKTKFEIEKIFLAAADKIQVSILRPTGVIGPHGQNLKKMLNEIRSESAIANYLRSSLYGKRPLNLVPVKDVVRALLHLHIHDIPGVYICSADDDPHNTYYNVEEIMRRLIHKPPQIKPLQINIPLLDLFLRVLRSGSGRIARRYYSSEKLFSTGFERTISIPESVKDFVLSEMK